MHRRPSPGARRTGAEGKAGKGSGSQHRDPPAASSPPQGPSSTRSLADLAKGPEGAGLREGQSGVHQSAHGRLLPRDAVVVIVFRVLLVPPG